MNNKGFTLTELMILLVLIGSVLITLFMLVVGIAFGYKVWNAIPDPPPAQVLDMGGEQ